MPKRRIKHNDLLPWFTMDHGQLPAAYLRKCRKFFNSIQHMLITKKDAAFLFKHRATSSKPQARKPASLTNQLGNYKKDI